ncbi:hypothetical protein [Streptomyces axinellae]|uniref:Uncharacterized protein n=1 Tax=Streptomyces axinellae TaxID=552788 RepID=A0ABP6C397_9ACTN
MPEPLGATEINLDSLIDDLDARIMETDLPGTSVDSGVCSNLCSIVICQTAVIC